MTKFEQVMQNLNDCLLGAHEREDGQGEWCLIRPDELAALIKLAYAHSEPSFYGTAQLEAIRQLEACANGH